MTVPRPGLSSAEVAARTADGRSNAWVPPSSRSVGSIIRANVLTRFNVIVLFCFVVLLAIGRWQDALFGASALLNAVIGSVQEYRAKQALDRLALVNAPHARVRRDGAQSEIPTGEVVADDLLELRPGDQVAADAEVIDAQALQLDESQLTGESDPVDKAPGAEVLSGSVVVGGAGLARVVRVGAESYANRFADEARRFSLVASELRSGIDRVLTVIGWLVLPVGLLVLNSQMVAFGGWGEALASGAWRDAVVATVAAVVAMIPLGLVLMTSITFAVGAVKLARAQVLVQELAAVEGLARVDLICLDKTGTLTHGDIVFDDTHPLGAAVPTGAADWERVLAWYGAQPDANATARGLAVRYTEGSDLAPSGTVAFSSARKWSAVSFAGGAPGTWVLGGPEMVFPGGSPAVPDLAARVEELAGTGRRTLVLAHTPQGADGSLGEDDVLPAGPVPVALLTFRERIRDDAAETLAYFAEQDVAVRIISGDNPQTVAAIARSVGLDAPHGVDARELPDDDGALAQVLESNLVFGRVTPEQKRRFVEVLKARGHTVGMTGDGVNDALAIKAADLGIAMESGAPATKAVARIVLLDGRFSHLPGVVREGRQVIANVERVSMLFFTKTAYAVALAILFGALLIEFPFLPRQLSVTDGLTIGIPAFFLALLPTARRYEPGFLRRSLSFAIPAGLVVTAALLVSTLVARSLGIPEDELRTGTTLVLALVGLWVLIVLARPIGVLKAAVIGAMMLGLILVFLVDPVRDFLRLVDPSLPTALIALVTTVGAIALIEVVRAVHRRLVRGWSARRSAAPAPST